MKSNFSSLQVADDCCHDPGIAEPFLGPGFLGAETVDAPRDTIDDWEEVRFQFVVQQVPELVAADEIFLGIKCGNSRSHGSQEQIHSRVRPSFAACSATNAVSAGRENQAKAVERII